jgi:PAS domain S-box-containing protein
MGEALNVLIAAGDHDVFLTIERHLTQQRFSAHCHCVTALSELTAAIGQGGWDVVLAGNYVKGSDLSGILAAVKALDGNLPVISVSGSVGDEQAVERLKRGAWDFVRNDNLARLIPAIQRSLQEAAARRDRASAEGELRESLELYRLLAEYAEDFVALHHADGRSLYLSPSYFRVTGWRPEEINVTDWRTRAHPDDRALVEKAREANLRGEATCIEHRSLCKDGSWLWVETRCRPLRGADGKVDRMVLWSRDITERKQAAAKHERLMTQFLQAQKMEAVGRLAGGVAHDFNNMLQTIMGTTEVLLHATEPDDPRVAELNEIAKAARRSADLTRQLLAFARKQTIIPKVLDLNNAVADTLKMLRRLIGEYVELHWCPASDLWPVEMDPSQLDQILANLVVNARDAITGPGRVTIKTGKAVFDEAYCQAHPEARCGEHVMLAVSDSGCGMDKETLARLFEPFFTTKGEGKGTGLGLATVYGIVQQNHGTLSVTSEPRQGTTIRIYLPRHTQAAGSAGSTSKTATAIVGAETVLLVEDEESLLRLARRLLETLGYNVLSAGGPQEALRQAAEYEGEIHLLLADVIMPVMDGRTLQQRLKEMRPEMKCLFMSGYPADAIAHCGVLEKGIYLIQKPFTRADLGVKLREVLAAKAE